MSDRETGAARVRQIVEQIRARLRCHESVGWRNHYCPNCDNTIDVEALLDQLAALPVVRLQGVIDARCSCAKCRERTENIYRQVSGICLNCGAGPFLILYREGDPASAQDCPRCKAGYRPVSALRPATDDEIPVAALPVVSEEGRQKKEDDLSRRDKHASASGNPPQPATGEK